MTTTALAPASPVDTAEVADLRATAHGAGTAACIALLTFAAELALEIIPAGPEREEGCRALGLAARLAAGEPVDPVTIVDALHDENDEGVSIRLQLAPEGSQAGAWGTVVGALGYAAYHGSLHRGEKPYPLVENYALKEALGLTVDLFASVPGLDWAEVGRACAYVRKKGSKAASGWGEPLRVEDLRRAAMG